ncbi:MAG: PD-(D/E)XK nuclease family protein [bacterium]
MIFDHLELNFSKIKTWLDCRVLYRHIYVEQKRAPLSAGAALGISLHRALEVYHKRGGDLDDLMLFYDDSWVNRGFENPQEQAECYNRGRDMLEKHWFEDQDRKSKIVHVEKDFAFTFEKWSIRGTIDRIDRNPDGTWEVIDYKTGPEVKTEDELKKSLQMGMYGLGMKRALGIHPDFVTFWFLAHTGRVTFAYDASREDDVLSVLREAGEGILREGDFTPNVAHCRFCPIRKDCRFSAVSGHPEESG